MSAEVTYKKLQELQNPLVSENVKRVPCQRVDHRKSVDLILQQRRHRIVQTATGRRDNDVTLSADGV